MSFPNLPNIDQHPVQLMLSHTSRRSELRVLTMQKDWWVFLFKNTCYKQHLTWSNQTSSNPGICWLRFCGVPDVWKEKDSCMFSLKRTSEKVYNIRYKSFVQLAHLQPKSWSNCEGYVLWLEWPGLISPKGTPEVKVNERCKAGPADSGHTDHASHATWDTGSWYQGEPKMNSQTIKKVTNSNVM